MTADPVPLIEQSPTVCFLESEALSSRAGVQRSDDLPPAVQETTSKKCRGKVRNSHTQWCGEKVKHPLPVKYEETLAYWQCLLALS